MCRTIHMKAAKHRKASRNGQKQHMPSPLSSIITLITPFLLPRFRLASYSYVSQNYLLLPLAGLYLERNPTA